jgi:hypothetical protein
MIDLTLKILRLDDFKGVSENIDIAKGKYELKMSIKSAWKQYKRFKK